MVGVARPARAIRFSVDFERLAINVRSFPPLAKLQQPAIL
jgi:hypothetical protein